MENKFCQDANSINEDPLLTNPGAGDFTLKSGSPAIDTGTDLGATYDDGLNPWITWPSNVTTLNQTSYGSWDIGAYVFDGWDRGDGWVSGVQVASCNGTQAAESLLSQPNIAVIAGKQYVLTYTLTRTAGSITPEVGSTNGTARNVSGNYSERITATDTDYPKFKADADFVGTVDDVVLYTQMGINILSN